MSSDKDLTTTAAPSSQLYGWDRSPTDLEAAVLGCLLARPNEDAVTVVDGLSEEAFSHSHLRAIFRAVRTLQADGLAFGPVEVTDRLRAQGTLTDDDPVYLCQLVESAFAPSLLSSLVSKLRTAARRQLTCDLARVLHDVAETPAPDFTGMAALLHTVANTLEEDRPDQALHDLTTYTRSRRYAAQRRAGR